MKQNKSLKKFLSTVSVCMLACSPAVMAIPTITVYTGLEGGSGDVDNVLYQNSQIGTSVNATINTKPGYAAIFTSTTSLKESGG